jgi:hypothetical protein
MIHVGEFEHKFEFTILTSHLVTEHAQSGEVRSLRVEDVPFFPLILGKESTGGLSEQQLPWEPVSCWLSDTSGMSDVEFDTGFRGAFIRAWNSTLPSFG